MRRALARALRLDGFTVVQAENGAVALRALRDIENSLKLVLTDIRMPVMDGIELDPAVLSPILRRDSTVLRAESVELRQRARFLFRRVRHQFARSNDLLTVSRFQRRPETSTACTGPRLVRQAHFDG